MHRFIAPLLFLLLIAGTASAQDIHIYNGYGYGYGYGRNDFSRSTTHFVPYYIDPFYENMMYQRMKKAQRYQNHIRVCMMHREEMLNARYRARMRLQGININMYSE